MAKKATAKKKTQRRRPPTHIEACSRLVGATVVIQHNGIVQRYIVRILRSEEPWFLRNTLRLRCGIEGEIVSTGAPQWVPRKQSAKKVTR